MREVLYGASYSEPKYYKLQSVLLRKPEIIIVGSSRVLSTTKNFFRDPSIFFNAGIAGDSHFQDYRYFLSRIPRENKPKIVIFGIDQVIFNTNKLTRFQDMVIPDDFNTELSPTTVFFSAWDKVYQYLFAGKISFSLFFGEKNVAYDKIGLTAFLGNQGFFNDGSYHWAAANDELKSPFKPEEFIVKRGDDIEHINGGRVPNQQRIDDLDVLLGEWAAENIHVIGFLPPISHVAYEKLKNTSSNAAYFMNLDDALQPIFRKYNFSVYDFSDPESYGSSDSEMIDSDHASQKSAARFFIILAEHDDMLKNYIDIQDLREKIKKTKSSVNI